MTTDGGTGNTASSAAVDLADAIPAMCDFATMTRHPLGQLARQVRMLTHRYLGLQLADIPSLGTILGQCLLVAFLLIVARLVAQLFISVYWGYRALAVLLPEEIASCLGADDWSAAAAFAVLLVHLGCSSPELLPC